MKIKQKTGEVVQRINIAYKIRAQADWSTIIILLVITLASFTIRIDKNSFGLPSVSHEEFSTLGLAWKRNQANSFNPEWFRWPNLLFYIELFILKLL